MIMLKVNQRRLSFGTKTIWNLAISTYIIFQTLSEYSKNFQELTEKKTC